MSELYMPIVALITGLIGMVWGADKFVNGSVGVAKNLGISSLVIGLTVVSIGTSAPEIIVSINAALKDSCLLYTSPSPRDGLLSRMPSSA